MEPEPATRPDAGEPPGKGEPLRAPVTWRPRPEQAASSNLGRFMAELGFSTYEELHAWSAAERAAFWEKVFDRLEIVLRRPPERLLDLAGGAENPCWLPGAAMNIVESCFTGNPARPAVVSGREGSRELTVTTLGELDGMARRFARGLARLGLGEGDGVALYMPMTVECVAAYLGTVRAGYRVISIADSFAPPQVRRRLELGGADVVVTVERFVRAGRSIDLHGRAREAGARRSIVVPTRPGRRPAGLAPGDLTWQEMLAEGSEPDPGPAVGSPERVTNVLFSSGTTGDPKAIPWTHLTPVKCAMDGHFHQDVRPGDVVAWPTNVGWMMGPWLIYASLINGAAMALFEGSPGGEEFARFVERAGVTVLGVVPSLVAAWRRAGAVGEGGRIGSGCASSPPPASPPAAATWSG